MSIEVPQSAPEGPGTKMHFPGATFRVRYLRVRLVPEAD